MIRDANRNRAQTQHAKSMRRDAAKLEHQLWSSLQGGKLGMAFERQHKIKPYVIDFYCEAAKLAIQLDGDIQRPVRATARTRFMSNKNIRVLHFSNRDLSEDFAGAITAIRDALNETPKRPVYPDEDLPIPA
jgi:very-short-patch-repair endonuclease